MDAHAAPLAPGDGKDPGDTQRRQHRTLPAFRALPQEPGTGQLGELATVKYAISPVRTPGSASSPAIGTSMTAPVTSASRTVAPSSPAIGKQFLSKTVVVRTSHGSSFSRVWTARHAWNGDCCAIGQCPVPSGETPHVLGELGLTPGRSREKLGLGHVKFGYPGDR